MTETIKVFWLLIGPQMLTGRRDRNELHAAATAAALTSIRRREATTATLNTPVLPGQREQIHANSNLLSSAGWFLIM